MARLVVGEVLMKWAGFGLIGALWALLSFGFGIQVGMHRADDRFLDHLAKDSKMRVECYRSNVINDPCIGLYTWKGMRYLQ